MSPTKLSIDQINSLGRADFVDVLGFLFEGSPWIAARAWDGRPFAGFAELHGVLCRAMYGASPEEQLALIRAHPDLVGRAALAGTLSPQSTGEQAAAGLDRLSSGEIARFTALNAEYRARFGFPFVICARENKKENILTGFATRLRNSPEEEIQAALREISKIAWLRLQDLADA